MKRLDVAEDRLQIGFRGRNVHAQQIHQRGMKMAVEHHASSPLPDANVAMSSNAIVSQPELLRWFVTTARTAILTNLTKEAVTAAMSPVPNSP